MDQSINPLCEAVKHFFLRTFSVWEASISVLCPWGLLRPAFALETVYTLLNRLFSGWWASVRRFSHIYWFATKSCSLSPLGMNDMISYPPQIFCRIVWVTPDIYVGMYPRFEHQQPNSWVRSITRWETLLRRGTHSFAVEPLLAQEDPNLPHLFPSTGRQRCGEF